MRTTASVSSLRQTMAAALMLAGALCLSACGGSEKQEDNPSKAHASTPRTQASDQPERDQAADDQDDDATLSADERRRRRLGLGSGTVEPNGGEPTFEAAPPEDETTETPESAEATSDPQPETSAPEAVESTPPSTATETLKSSSSDESEATEMQALDVEKKAELVESTGADMPPIEDDHRAAFVAWVEAMGEAYEGLSDASTKEDYADLAITMLMARTHYQYLTAEAGDDWNTLMPQEVKDASMLFVKYSRAVMKSAHVDWKHPRVAPVKERSENLADELAEME